MSPSHLKGRPAVLQKEHPFSPKTMSLSHNGPGSQLEASRKAGSHRSPSGQSELEEKPGLGGRGLILVACNLRPLL